MIGELIRPHLTVDGLRSLIADLAKTGSAPRAILVSEYDRRELNQDLLAGSIAPVAKDDRRPAHDGQAVGVIDGVIVASHPDVARGKARLVF